MRGAGLNGARAVLLAGPAVLAFFSGGYFDEARNWAGLAAWLLVLLALILVRDPLPRGRPARMALGGLTLLAGWTLLSITWAPIRGTAYHAGQLALLYLGGLLSTMLLLRSRPAQRALEPALAAGALVVIGYALSERLVPGLLQFSRSASAQGRLEQPLTYWNAMGEVAALGFVLCSHLAGDATRGQRIRMAASASAVPFGLGLYLSFSRGALFACAAGVVTLVVLVRRRESLLSLAGAVVVGTLAAVATSPFAAVTSLLGSRSTRESQGAIVLVLLVVLAAAAVVGQWWIGRRPPAGELRLPRPAPWIALALILGGLALAIVAGAKEHSKRPLSPGASRFVTLQSNRYDYWRVALRAFGDQPLRGVGAGGWAVYWLRYRTIDEFARDAHSLPLQTAAELGVVGLALLAAFLAGTAAAARAGLRAAPELAAGPIAGFVVWVAHSPLDWDWQMPAVTLLAMGLAGGLLALERPPATDRQPSRHNGLALNHPRMPDGG